MAPSLSVPYKKGHRIDFLEVECPNECAIVSSRVFSTKHIQTLNRNKSILKMKGLRLILYIL